ncbi:Isochorismatase hydrolase [Microthyrium microscopicum]|uniref:nicotinamidase n=1 Tax=Microthyrium microscopicum TaxID=703497 RepID=A0A6A6U5W4_9PEZI|nr:Isochorismatase hydrolase [Microthyrium microscopicum]
MAFFKPALIIVDFQEDFCPPNGSLAVANGGDIAPVVNQLLDLPFVVKVATKDWHPPDHISFASNHKDAKAFQTSITIQNPLNDEETETTLLWPDHCIQNTPGSQLVPELHINKITHIVEKGTDKRVEMYSAFQDPFPTPVSKSSLAHLLKSVGVTHCYVVGLAYDYCVKYTAIDAAKEGFKTFIIREGTKPVDPSPENIAKLETALQEAGVSLIGHEDAELKRIQNLPPPDAVASSHGI